MLKRDRSASGVVEPMGTHIFSWTIDPLSGVIWHGGHVNRHRRVHRRRMRACFASAAISQKTCSKTALTILSIFINSFIVSSNQQKRQKIHCCVTHYGTSPRQIPSIESFWVLSFSTQKNVDHLVVKHSKKRRTII